MADYTDFETFTDYWIFDADQHIYEPLDCYLRHIPAQYAERTIRPAVVDGKKVCIAEADRVIGVDNEADQCYRPGSLKELLKGLKKGSGEQGAYQFMEMDPAFIDRQRRIEMLDRQHVQAAILYCGSLGLVADHYLEDDDLYYASSWAYLQWLEEAWGFDRDGRILTAPVVSLRDLDRTCEQLDWLFERGARVISLLPGPGHGRSPGDPYFDRFWGRIEDAGALVCYHINEAIPGYKASRSVLWGQDPYPSFFTQSAWQWCWAYGEQPAMETFSALIFDNLFGRFPGLRILSAEHGCEWAPGFARKIDKMRGMGRNGPWIGGPLTDRPSEIFKRHFRLVPYWEDDPRPVIEALGRDVVVGGSDFPHSEGLAFPTQLVEHLKGLGPVDERYIMRDNGLALVGLADRSSNA